MVTTVGYLDWEMDGHEHRHRLERLCGDDMPGHRLHPVRPPLADDVDRIRREVIRHGIGYPVSTQSHWRATGHPRRQR